MIEQKPSRSSRREASYVLVRPFKNMAIAILLALFLGPIGLLYSTFLGGVIMALVVFVFLAAMTANPAVGPIVWVSWLVCPFWAVLAAGRHNKKMMKRWEKNHNEP
jgi:predicted membrane metal-binding protein